MGQPETVGGRRLRWHWLVIPLCGVVGLAAAIVSVATTTPTYTANAYGFVAFTPTPGDPDSTNPYASGLFAQQRAPTYAALATSTEVLKAVLADVHHGDVDQLRSQVQATAIPGKVILQISVVNSDPQSAAQIANSVIANLGRTVSWWSEVARVSLS